jgi:hypothetical protein
MRNSPTFFLALCFATTIARAADDKPTPLINGKDLTGWSVTDKDRAPLWSVAASVALDPKNPKALTASGQPQDDKGLLVAQLKDFQGTNLVSTQKFGDCTIRLEFLLPKDGNSGLFLMGLYELQLTDSTGIPDAKIQEGDMGSIPFFKKPLLNASGKPGEWQTCEVTFQAPRFGEGGKKTANAKILRAVINGKTVQENLDLPEPSGGGLDTPESATGPVLLQGNEGPVAFRTVTVTPNK